MTDTTVVLAAKKRLDVAVCAYVAAIHEPDMCVTGWCLGVSMLSPTSEPDEDYYVTVRQPGMPFHAALGLLNNSTNALYRGKT